MPRDQLLGYLSGISGGSDLRPNETPGSKSGGVVGASHGVQACIDLCPCLARSVDNSIVALKYPGLYLISTVDFFYPSVEDPYLQVSQCLYTDDWPCPSLAPRAHAALSRAGPHRSLQCAL